MSKKEFNWQVRGLENIIRILDIDNVEIIAAAHKKKKTVSYREDIENTILGTISRRPCTIDDLSEILDMTVVELNKYIRILKDDGRIESVDLDRGTFYTVTQGHGDTVTQ